MSQTTYKDLSILDKKSQTFYMGFDASSDSQAIGNLAAMMFIYALIRHGYDAIILTGGSTSLIGDPKDTSERELQSEETIAHNTMCAQKQIEKIFSGQKFRVVNNLDWTRDVKLLDFLREIGKRYSMTNLVQRDFIAQRMGEGGSGISFAEFSYTLLQGYDYLHLYDKYGCTLQLGGSDQWGNCLSGVELIRKTRGAEVDVITLNLVIDKSTGRKFGKSEAGAVWLDSSKTSIYKFYQFWLNTDDLSVIDFLKIYTVLSKDEIDELSARFEQSSSDRLAQRTLAYEVTVIVHGREMADRQKRIAEALFGESSLAELDENEVAIIRQEMPSAKVSIGDSIIDVMVRTGLASSKSEARRLSQSGAVYLSGVPVRHVTFGSEDLLDGKLLLRKGKSLSNSALIEIK